jgi:cell division protein ZipA
MKDWVIIIGTLLILLVLADGIRRKRNERNGNIKVSRSLNKTLKQTADFEDDSPAEAPSYTSELPNGGARVVGQRDPSVRVPSIEKKPKARSYIDKHQQHAADAKIRTQREPQQSSLNLGQSVPMLMESVEDSKVGNLPLHERIEPSLSASRTEDLDEDYEEQDAYDHEEEDYEGEDYESNDHPYTRAVDEEEDSYAEDDEAELEEENDSLEEDEFGHNNEYDGDIEEDYEDDFEEEEEEPQSSAQQHFAEKQPAEPEEVLIINVMAHKGEMFNGGELLDIILKCGMRYGNMDIFHRHSDTKGEGALLFSMANMVKPGTFDLDAMDEFETPGVSLFMTLPINADSMQSFDLMADTARAIAETLDGELKDEQRSVMTRQTLEHCRQRIRDFERMRLFRRPPRN